MVPFYIIQMIEQSGLKHEHEQKCLDSTTALEKVIRLDKKHTNFDYIDTVRSASLRITYPNSSAEGPSSELLLKSLWKHMANYYFKDIEESDYDRLNYIETIIHCQFQGEYRFHGDEHFWDALTKVFTQRYIQRYLNSTNQKADYHNWLEYMHICWRIVNSNDLKESKKLISHFQTLKVEAKHIFQKRHSEKLKLHYESKELAKIIKPDKSREDDEISQQIAKLQQQIKEINQQSSDIFMRLKKSVQKELIQAKLLVEISSLSDSQMKAQCSEQDYLVFNDKTRIDDRLKKVQYFDVQSKYIEYLIGLLQKKQIAESISKLYRVQKSKGEIKVQLFFQESMGIKPILVTQDQFNQLNSLREYSLLKFYNTATKSRYSFVCQNYLGFRDIFENRTKPCKLKNKDIFELMKKTTTDSLGSSYYKEFSKMEICHHCKLLYPEVSLAKCQYHSVKHGNPIPLSPYYDSYVYQILKNDQSKVSSIRSFNNSESRRNSYFQYMKEGQECACNRRFCKYCLKNYEQSRQKNSGLCPYCRSICFCTRCSRNDMIVRLKSMYILLGGDINKLQKDSWFERYYLSSEEQMGLRKKEKSSKSSRRFSSLPSKMNEKMLNVRYQLQDLRIICDLVKRRQKHKQKKFSCQKLIFRGKVSHLCADISFGSLQQAPKVISEVKMSQKLNKKLKRMIT